MARKVDQTRFHSNEEAQYLINWFIEQFVAVCSRHESEYLTLEHFAEIASDNEVRRRTLLAPNVEVKVTVVAAICSI